MKTIEVTNLGTSVQQKSLGVRKFVGQVALGVGRILIFLLTVLIGLPILLLPYTTSVPAPVWILLAIAGMGLIILPFRLRSAVRGMAMSFGGMLAVSLFASIVSQIFVTTPPITDAKGNILPSSIAALEKVSLNGSQQWISIRGKDVNNPILLFLAGGPGGSQLVTERRALGALEDHFIVVNWEQPGAGKSFDAVERSTLTPERYITDGLALVAYLRQRFDEEKVYVLGESWGSALGIWMVEREPEAFYAFIGTGQMVAFLDTDLMCYDFALKWAQERGDVKKIVQLQKQGPPPYYGKGMSLKEAVYLMDTFNYMNQNPAIADDGFNTFQDLAGSEYGLYDKLNWFRGPLGETLDVVYPQLWDVDFREQATRLEVAVYFLIGRHDVNAPTVLAEQYFEILEAPHKEFLWFERSGHNPWVTESSAFVDVVVNRVLTQTYPSND